MHLGIDEERFGLRLRGALGQRHRFRRRGRLVEQRSVGDVEPGQVADHGLEIEQRLQPALADLRLIRRIGRVPRRIFQDVALDHRRQDRAGIALADQRGEHLDSAMQARAICASASVSLKARAEIERRLLPDRRRQGLGHQRLEALRRPHSPASPRCRGARGRYGGGRKWLRLRRQCLRCAVMGLSSILTPCALVGGLIHQAVEFALVRDLHFEKPGLAAGVGIDQRRLGRRARSLTSSTSPEIGA